MDLYVRHLTRQGLTPALALCAGVLMLMAGCASSPDGQSIYVPIGGGEDSREVQSESSEPQREPRQDSERGQPQQDTQPQAEPSQPAPSHRTQGQAISPAAASLVQQADEAFQAGKINAGMSLLQRAQRISPDASVIYYKMAEGHVLAGNLARAEQFAMKGVSVAGANDRLQRSGWQLLSDIRRAQGDMAGAQDAENRASML